MPDFSLSTEHDLSTYLILIWFFITIAVYLYPTLLQYEQQRQAIEMQDLRCHQCQGQLDFLADPNEMAPPLCSACAQDMF